MTAQVLKLPVSTKLVCSGCGAPGEGSCDCGEPYVAAGARAAAAHAASPGKSSRALAEEAGVGETTVRRARAAEPGAPHGARVAFEQPSRRQGTVTGRDGKSYPATRKPRAPEPPPQSVTPFEKRDRLLFSGRMWVACDNVDPAARAVFPDVGDLVKTIAKEMDRQKAFTSDVQNKIHRIEKANALILALGLNLSDLEPLVIEEKHALFKGGDGS